MATVGILAGRERSFPDAVLARLNEAAPGSAEYATLGGWRMDEPLAYRVYWDRISHAVPFYQSVLKSAATLGAWVVNDPFWQLAEDKFLDTCVALASGLKV